jgi:hypothetical protein
MPTTPLDADAIMRVHYTAIGFEHVINLRINLVEPYDIGQDVYIMSFTGAEYNINSAGLWGSVKTQMKALFKSSDHLTGYEIWDLQTSPPTWIFAASESVAGTSAGSQLDPAVQTTINFQDKEGKHFKHTWIGTASGGRRRLTSFAGEDVSGWVGQMTSSAPSVLGDYICGRSAHRCLRAMSATFQTNNAWDAKILNP